MAITPWEFTKGLQIPGNTDRGSVAFDPVPAGQVLIVRHVSAEFLINGRLTLFAVSHIANSRGHWFLPVSTGSMGNEQTFLVSQQCQIYVAAGEILSAFAIRQPIQGDVNGAVTISGELIPA